MDVESQRADPDSTLHLVRELIALRRAFVREPYEALPSPPGAWVYRRGDHVISIAFDGEPPDGPGEVVLATAGAVIRRVG